MKQEYKVISLKTKQEVKIGDLLDNRGAVLLGFRLKLFHPKGVIVVGFEKDIEKQKEHYPHVYGLEIVPK